MFHSHFIEQKMQTTCTSRPNLLDNVLHWLPAITGDNISDKIKPEFNKLKDFTAFYGLRNSREHWTLENFSKKTPQLFLFVC